ncbi:hypothetical protein QSH57_008695 [Fusarium oxysporum f. sp. vasinfectum]|nr:hypothetical protein QSH57_008695 [Fusarium oxysporum f. sp. vasinfectum]
MPLNQSSPEKTPPPPTDHFHPDFFNGSHETVPSDPQEWHNDVSHNATAYNNPVDVNLPYFQEESDLLDPEKLHLHTRYQANPPIPNTAHSNSSDDYRGVIDDLTLEIQQLRKELKRYKQSGPALLHKDKLFEIKVYGLPHKKKGELETILRDLAADLDGSPEASSSQKWKKISPQDRDYIYSKSGVQPGGESSRTPFYLPILPSTKASKGKVEDYLRDVPDGLYPQHVIMTDKERKSLVVRRLEQLFTGRSGSADISKMPPLRPGGSFIMARVVADAQMAKPSSAHEPPIHETEPIREARILSLEQKSRAWRDQCYISNHGSASDPEKDNMETEGNDNGLVSSTKPFPPLPLPPKQQPTRPCDLDPDPVDDDNPGRSGLGLNYSRGSAGKWQHHEGAITYYSGAPFCTDLSGDPADLSPTTRTPSSAQNRKDSQQLPNFARSPRRTTSGSFISYRPLTDRCQDLHQQISAMGEDNNEVRGLINDDREQSSDIELDLIWNDAQQDMGQQPLVPCGLGGVLPDDHFTVVVDTKRPKQDVLPWASELQTGRSNESIERTIRRRAAMLTSCPVPSGSEAKAIEAPPPIEIEYLSWRMERLIPVPLPCPANIFPPFGIHNSTSDEDDDPSIDADNAGLSRGAYGPIDDFMSFQ